jgi:hypothetical protein
LNKAVKERRAKNFHLMDPDNSTKVWVLDRIIRRAVEMGDKVLVCC